MAIIAVQAALDILELLDKRFPEWKPARFGQLNVILRFLRTFFLYASNRCENMHCKSILRNIDETVSDRAQEIQSIGLISMDSDERVISEAKDLFRKESIQSISSRDSLQDVKLVDVMDSLLENLQDLVHFMSSRRTSTGLIEEVEGNVKFLKNFIMFATFQGVEHSQMKALLAFVEGLVIDVACLTLMFRYDGNPPTKHMYELAKRIKPFESHVFGIYTEVLQEASKLSMSSRHYIRGSQRIVYGNFVNSLFFLLWELLSIDNSCADTFNRHLHNLSGDLTFLRTLLRAQKNNDLDEKMHELIGVVVCEAGIIVSCLS